MLKELQDRVTGLEARIDELEMLAKNEQESFLPSNPNVIMLLASLDQHVTNIEAIVQRILDRKARTTKQSEMLAVQNRILEALKRLQILTQLEI